jgi:hypothetical protein
MGKSIIINGKKLIVKGADFLENAVVRGTPDIVLSDFTSFGNYFISEVTGKIVAGNQQYPQQSYYIELDGIYTFQFEINEDALIRWGVFNDTPALGSKPVASYLDDECGNKKILTVRNVVGKYFWFSVGATREVTVSGYSSAANPDFVLSDFTSFGNYYINDSNNIVAGNVQYPQQSYYIELDGECTFDIKFIGEWSLVRWGVFDSQPALNSTASRSYKNYPSVDSDEVTVRVMTGAYFFFSVGATREITADGYTTAYELDNT